jgi:Carboxypeptidase regulatory-like domain
MSKSTCRSQRIPIALLVLGAFAVCGRAAVQVTGHITDQASGAPVAGLAISLIQLPSGASSEPQVFRTTSRPDGSYLIEVSPGSYRICAEEVQGYLDPCQWRLGSTDFVASAVAAQAVRDFTLERGRKLIVRVLDSAASLTVASLAGVAAPALSISVVDSTGKIRVVPFRKTVGAVHEFTLLVPLASYSLHVSSPVANLASPDGAALTSAGYNTAIDTSVIPAALPSWLPPWLASHSGQQSTVIALSTIAAPEH